MFAKLFTIAATGIAAVHACYPANPTNMQPFTLPSHANYPTIGQPFLIEWDNTNQGPTVTLSLYHGCPENCNEVTDIVGGLANTGSYTWNVQCTADWPYLQADETNLGYAIFLIDEQGCKTSWSLTFGLHPDSAGCCGNTPGAGCNKPVVASSAVSSPTSTTTTATATSAASTTTTGTTTTNKSTTTTATTVASIKSLTTATTAATTKAATSTTAAAATASSKSGAAAATAPAQALGGVVALLAAGLVL